MMLPMHALALRAEAARMPIRAWVVAFFIAWSVRATVLYSLVDARLSLEWRALYATTVKVVVWMGAALLLASPRSFRLIGWRGPRRLGLALATAALYLTLVLTDLTIRRLGSVPWRVSVSPLAMAGVAHIVASCLVEEVLFRGALLAHLEGRLAAPWQANLAQAGLFAAIHLPLWLWTRGLTPSVPIDAFGVALLGLVAGATVQMSRSLWPAVLMHATNNWMMGTLGPG
jgi:membrane protease YdiL (CAAX protease family)